MDFHSSDSNLLTLEDSIKAAEASVEVLGTTGIEARGIPRAPECNAPR